LKDVAPDALAIAQAAGSGAATRGERLLVSTIFLVSRQNARWLSCVGLRTSGLQPLFDFTEPVADEPRIVFPCGHPEVHPTADRGLTSVVMGGDLSPGELGFGIDTRSRDLHASKDIDSLS